jgi:hypothetical protein
MLRKHNDRSSTKLTKAVVKQMTPLWIPIYLFIQMQRLLSFFFPHDGFFAYFFVGVISEASGNEVYDDLLSLHCLRNFHHLPVAEVLSFL